MLMLILLCGIVTLLIQLYLYRDLKSTIAVSWFDGYHLFRSHYLRHLSLIGIIQTTPHGEGYTLNIPYIIALIPTVILSIITRSLTITIISGIVIMAALRFFF